MMRIAAFSRKFPPTFKRRWYICNAGKYNRFYLRYIYEPSTVLRARLTSLTDALITVEALNWYRGRDEDLIDPEKWKFHEAKMTQAKDVVVDGIMEFARANEATADELRGWLVEAGCSEEEIGEKIKTFLFTT